jgi:glyoxylase-like metal-dependent hydrolase (beta-lactamase superfamily II)
MRIQQFTFNDFYENTYILSDDTKECVIIDPGCNISYEHQLLESYVEENKLTPVMLLNTHCHIDHVLGNAYVANKYGISLFAHEIEKIVLDAQPMVAMRYGIPYTPSPLISAYLKHEQVIKFGDTELKVLFVPGHSPGHICLYHISSNTLIAGDALFKGSIGRTDLPGGDYDTLINSIKDQLFTLPDETKVYSGHGETTFIGIEKKTNPFFV